MIYLENPPAYEALQEEFAWEKTFAKESDDRQRRHPFLHKVSRASKEMVQRLTRRNKLMDLVTRYFPAGEVLDIGCAGGHTLRSLPPKYTPYGIEISLELSQIAAKAFGDRGGSVLQTDALTGLSQLPNSKFSGVIMTSYLEHDTQAREILVAVHRVMRKGARLIVKVPNYASWNRSVRGDRWCGLRFPDHVNYFTPRTLRHLLSLTGFQVVQFGLRDRLPTSDTMWLVAETRST